jgi:xanthine/uracil permease
MTDQDEQPNGTTEVRTDGGVEKGSMVEIGIDQKPPLGTSVLLGVQHYLTMIGSTIAVPLVLAGAMGMPASETARLVGTFFVVSGIATLAQTTIGNQYPLVQGASFAILTPGLAIVGTLAATDAGWNTMILELQGAMIVAGMLQVLIGYLGLFGYLKRYLSPVVIAPVIALIGLSLFEAPQITNPETQSLWLMGLTLLLIIGFSQYLSGYSRLMKLFPVLLGLVTAWAIAAILSVTGVLSQEANAFVNISTATDPAIIQPIVPFQWGMPQFTTAFVIGMFAGVVASMIESFGDYYAVARISGEQAPSGKRINHGLGMEGLGNVFAGIMGTGNGSSSYSENIGAIGITSVASRYVVQIGAIVMILAGYIGVVGGFVTTIPDPIVGGLFLVMFAQIIGVGISQIQYVDLNKNRNVFIIGLALISGLSIPAYVNNWTGGDATVIEEALINLAGIGPILESLNNIQFIGTVFGPEALSQILVVVGTTGIAVGGTLAFILDLTIPGTRKGRGLTAWDDLTEDDDDFVPAHKRLFGDTPTETSKSD